MKILALNLDTVGEMLPFCLRCIASGHSVRLYLGKGNHKETANGFKGIEKVEDWLPSVRWADLIVPSGNHQFMEKLAFVGKGKMFGPSPKSAALEIERQKGMKFFEDHGIEVPEYKTFKTLGEAQSHVRKTGERFVFKTLGDEADKSLSYVAETPADMVARLQRWERLGMAPKGPVMLQKVIDGVEFAVSRWMGSEGFIGQYNENFEFKKLLSGNCGPNCGEAGTVMKYVTESPLGEEVLAPLEDDLLALGHRGDIDVNCIVDPSGKVFPLEFTARLGWPAFNIMLSEHKGDPAVWMKDALEGRDSLEVSPKVACGIVVSQPDYPNSKLTKRELEGIPIYGVTGENKKHIHPQAVKVDLQPTMEGTEIVHKPTWTTTGDYLAVVTGLGRTVQQACQTAYKTVKELHIPNMQYRDDVGEKLEKELPELQKHGFAEEFKYG
jgi:phosphoribosylamine---glycine ligase